nr:HEAT repeat domain-containing protein [Leptospira abararensis]
MIRLVFIILLSLFSFVLPVFAEGLDQGKLDQLIASLSLSRHPGDVDFKKLATAVDPNPVPYLKEIIENSPVRVYVKVNAVKALSEFESPEAKSSLENNLSNSNQHRLVRQSAIKSYVSKYYESDPNAISVKVKSLIKEREFLDYAEKSMDSSKMKQSFNKNSKDAIKKMQISEEQKNSRKLQKD